MKTTIFFYISEEMQKELLNNGENAEKHQSIELDLTDQELIDLATIDYKGNATIATIRIDSDHYHYDDNEEWKREDCYFDFIPAENDLIIFFANEKQKKIRDEEIREKNDLKREEERKIREIEEEKERIEKEKEKKEKEEQEEKNQKEIDVFVDQQGSEKLKLRKELGYEYNHLAINEMIDKIECKYEKIDSDNYDVDYIDYPSEKMMKAQKKLLKNKNVYDVGCRLFVEIENEYNYDEEKEKIEVFQIYYDILGYKKSRYYIFS